MNQGLYNGFLAAGLIWGLLAGRRDVKVFFLSCVVVAGIFGGITAKTSILVTQALPGLIALVCVLAASGGDGKRRRDPATGLNMVEAILFDFDLTLADSSAGVTECANHALRALGFAAAEPVGCIRRLDSRLSSRFEP
jgi:hypothetical protein